MSIGSGLSGSFGWSKESAAYGTRVAPAKFIRHRRCEFTPMFNRVQGEGIQSGALGLRGDQLVETHNAATASVEFDVTTLNMLQLWENLMGGSASVQQGVTAAYQHTFTLADNYATTNKSLTLQQNVPLRTGTDKAKEITGAKATSATFSCGIGELLTCQMEFDGYKYDTAQTLAAASYVSGVPYHFGQGTAAIGTFSSEATLSGVRSWSVTINRPMDTEGYQFNATRKQQPILNAPTEITGTLEMDYLATADAEDRMTGMTLPSLKLACVGATIENPYTAYWQIIIPGIHIEGAQNLDGYDVPRAQWNWTWKYDGSNLPRIQQQSTETSV